MSIDHLMEQQIKQLQFPEINVQDKVMKRLDSTTMKHTNHRLILAVVVLIFLIGTGFASVTFINLYNKSGSLAFSVKGFDENNTAPVLTEELSKKYLELIKPGEAIAIYSPVRNPNNIVSVLEKPIEIYSLKELRQYVEQSFLVPRDIPSHVIFKSGTVHHLLGQPNIQQLISKSQARNGEVVSEIMDVKDEIHGVTMNFLVNGNEYSASMYQGGRWNTVYTELKRMKETRIIQIRQSEGLLIFNEGKTVLLWRLEKEQGDVFYRITTDEQLDKAESNIIALLNLIIPSR